MAHRWWPKIFGQHQILGQVRILSFLLLTLQYMCDTVCVLQSWAILYLSLKVIVLHTTLCLNKARSSIFTTVWGRSSYRWRLKGPTVAVYHTTEIQAHNLFTRCRICAGSYLSLIMGARHTVTPWTTQPDAHTHTYKTNRCLQFTRVEGETGA